MSTRPVASSWELPTSKPAPLDQEASPPKPLAFTLEMQPPESATSAWEEQPPELTEWVTSPQFWPPTPGVSMQQGPPPVSAEVTLLFTATALSTSTKGEGNSA